ncbi:wax ester/triacylglycerol synthase family O-acyltransferase [Iamia majanohamensis]|uniref:Diacylglycerol O-acyltransferase n=1 Tax=Iamia majanohamensis TaxID=467976 RepID=A0AAE9Y8H0_9ACTN|nr:wax ester/triacylglycerol synthase family O-acyltransferase [Iamia majanohamensis]WCO68809.1 wax ester/triacylglycerol synthase family O-acyltransferase [Iamia majanohamensis]
MTGLDASFLYLETPSSHMHVASLMVLDPSEADEPVTLEKVKEVYGSRLHLAPPFRRRLVEVPFGLHHPLWIEDPDFDIDYHVRSTALPSPGSDAQLRTLVGRLVAQPLDRSRPLWEVWMIEGLEGGKVGCLSKVHHAAIDGASGNELTVAMLDLSPEIAEHPGGDDWEPDPVPSDIELLGYAATSLARQPVRVAKAGLRTTGAAFALRRRNRESPRLAPPSPFSAPRTELNVPITGRRSFGTTSLSLPAVKAVKKAAGCTVNDVVLALCAGSLRRYLAADGDLPDTPLVAMVPVSVRSDDERDSLGNRVTTTFTSLATDVDDPLARLQVIHDCMVDVKEQQQAIGADTLTDWAEFAAPAVAGRAAKLYSRVNVAGRHRPLFNVTISNVPGPPFSLYSIGAHMEAIYPIGPIADGVGPNMTVMSYRDSLDFGVLACPDVLPDVDRLTDGLHEALADLVEATGVSDDQVDALRSAT